MAEGYTIRELAEVSGTPLPSIKFYLRERLLDAGDLGAPARAYYSQDHLARLRLIRVLRDVSKLPIVTIRAVLRALDAGKNSVDVVAVAMDALGAHPGRRSDRAHTRAIGELQALLGQLGVKARPEAGAVRDLAAALVSLRRAWKPDLPAAALLPYAQLARQLAQREVDANKHAFQGDTRQLLEIAVQGTLLFEPILLGFRRIMHEHMARQLAQRAKRAQAKPGRRS